MRIPHIIHDNTIKAYEVSSLYLRNSRIKSDDFTWDWNFIKSLRELSIIVIAQNWERNPLYSKLLVPDRLQLLELLSVDLPLKLTVSIIDEDYYWKRCFEARWPRESEPNRTFKYVKSVRKVASYTENDGTGDHDERSVNFSDKNVLSCHTGSSIHSAVQSNSGHSEISEASTIRTRDGIIGKGGKCSCITIQKTWKQTFLQKFVEEEIERMKPDMFNPEYIKELTDLYGEYIICLNIRQLQPSKQKDGCNHISLHSLLANLPKLISFSVCCKQSNLGANFTWHTIEISDSDCELLGKGVEKCGLRILRVIRSNIDCHKVKLLIRPLVYHKFLQTLDLSHCKIADEGAKAIAGMLKSNVTIEKLVLVNNKIGPEGVRGLCYYLSNPESLLRELNLKLNPLQTEGGKYIGTALCRGAFNLHTLNISSCGLTAGNLHFGMALAMNTTLQKLDLSNNLLGEECVPNLLYAMQKNTSLIHLDTRMCGFLPESVQQIQTTVRRNLKTFRGVLLNPPSADKIY